MNKYRVVIWGNGEDYNRFLPLIKAHEDKNEIDVVGITSEDKYFRSLDGYPYISKKELIGTDYDYIIVTPQRLFNEIVAEGSEKYGISDELFINAKSFEVPYFSMDKLVQLKKKRISIVSDHCWGGLTYHYFALPFLSPFVNMFIEPDDFFILLSDLKNYMGYPLEYIGEEYNPVDKFDYPVFRLGDDVTLHMNHFHGRETAEIKWEERKKRINWDSLMVQMHTDSEEVAEKFSQLPFNNKICFTSFKTDIRDCFHLPVAEKITDVPYRWVVTGVARGIYQYYDPWDLLINNKITPRIAPSR